MGIVIKRTLEEKKEIVRQVQELTAGGMRVPDACKQAGVHYSTYFAWAKGEFGSKRKYMKKADKAPAVKTKPSPAVMIMPEAKPAPVLMQKGEFFLITNSAKHASEILASLLR